MPRLIFVHRGVSGNVAISLGIYVNESNQDNYALAFEAIRQAITECKMSVLVVYYLKNSSLYEIKV